MFVLHARMAFWWLNIPHRCWPRAGCAFLSHPSPTQRRSYWALAAVWARRSVPSASTARSTSSTQAINSAKSPGSNRQVFFCECMFKLGGRHEEKCPSATLCQALRAPTYVQYAYAPAGARHIVTSEHFPPCLPPLQPVCRLISADKLD
jgi:hypothetical protein